MLHQPPDLAAERRRPAFPGLAAEDVRAAVAFAADVVADEPVVLEEA